MLAMGILFTGQVLVVLVLLAIGFVWLGAVAVLGCVAWRSVRRDRLRATEATGQQVSRNDQSS